MPQRILINSCGEGGVTFQTSTNQALLSSLHPLKKSGRLDLNQRPHGPEPSALAS